MSNHTPPPWTVECGDEYGYYYIQEVAAEQAVSGAGSDYDALAATAEERDQANARLLAAAPELLSACLGIISAYKGERGITDSDIGTVLAAIAKAEGETHE